MIGRRGLYICGADKTRGGICENHVARKGDRCRFHKEAIELTGNDLAPSVQTLLKRAESLLAKAEKIDDPKLEVQLTRAACLCLATLAGVSGKIGWEWPITDPMEIEIAQEQKQIGSGH